MKYITWKKKAFNVTLGTLLAATLVACTGGGTDEGDKDEAADTLVIAHNTQPPSLDAHVSTANATAEVMRNVWEPLVAMDMENNPQPVLAESVTHNEDYSQTTFTLRDVKFHDGSDLDSKDVVDSIERWAKYSPAGAYFSNTEFETPDDKTVVMNSDHPFFSALTLLADPSQFPAIMPSETLEGIEKDGLDEFIGTGPYKFVEWQTDQHIKLQRNDEYQAPPALGDGLAGERVATYESLLFQIVPDPNTRLSGIQVGEYDIALSILPDNAAQIESSSDLILDVNQAGLIGMVFNKAEGELFHDQDLRHAIQTAIDMEAVMQGAYSSEEFYSLDGALGMPYQELWYNEEGLGEYNVADQAKVDEYLDAAGYGGEEIRFMATRDYPEYYNAAIVVEQQLKDAGFNVKLEVYDWPTLLSNASDPSKYEMYMTAWTDAAVPTKYTFMSAQGNGSTNDADLFGAIESVNFADSAENASEAMKELQRIHYDYLPMVKLGNRMALIAVNENIDGYYYQPGAGPIFMNARPKSNA